MSAASQLPGRGPSNVDVAPVPGYLHNNKKSGDDDEWASSKQKVGTIKLKTNDWKHIKYLLFLFQLIFI